MQLKNSFMKGLVNMKSALIIGGGIAGSAAAIEFKKRSGWNVTIAEKSGLLGAGLRTQYIHGHPCTFGPRHFLSHNSQTYEWLDKIVPLRLCKEHQFISYVDQDKQFYSYPIHEDDIPKMPESKIIFDEINNLEKSFRDREFLLTKGSPDAEFQAKNYKDFWVRSIGPTLYKKFISQYTKKMWMLDDESIIDDFSWSPKGVAIKRGPREGWEKAISAYPKNISGYDPIFLEAEKSCTILLNTPVEDITPGTLSAKVQGIYRNYDCIINTSPIDSLYTYQFGKLKYIGRTLQYSIFPVNMVLPENVYFSYYCGDEPYTRITEYKKFTQFQSSSTLISYETPSNNGRLYPLPIKVERERASEYFKLMHSNMYSIGRIGAFNYRFDIDDAIEQAIESVEKICS